MYNINKDRDSIRIKYTARTTLTVTGGSDANISSIYQTMKDDWLAQNPDKPMPDLIISHDEYGHPTMTYANLNR